MAASTDYKFEGWCGLDKESANGKMVWQELPKVKTWEETDVDIEISHCGICGSDLHTLRSGWGPTPYPVCVGHEIVGKAVRVGSKVEKGIKVGDRVGVGAQALSCLKADCEECQNGMEQHCQHTVNTFASPYPDGQMSYGGYADYNRTNSHFVFKIPEAIASEDAAPMLCGGITVYSPLKQNGCGPGKRVGIIGVGGLGHFGVLFAKALGADRVVGISRRNDKKEDVLKMGADEYIATEDEQGWNKKHARSLDLIICTVSSPAMPLMKYLQLLRVKGTFIQVGAPEDKLPDMNAFAFIAKGVKFGGSMIGAPHEIEEMLKLAADKKIKPWIQKVPMKDANKAIVDMDAGKARYRISLVNEKFAS
ncbi:Putative alcohol dehydrogenase, zinc-type, GroES-like superfamily, NAD(P)-binding domain superfamily [Septoria linicola]|uniref:alcohol dehydrogenase (NADP(+)) n=1 Tax=Septoria linicola TaxID=215465 RepID=A0A9Q9AH55_9PEZI|nr:putative alcohol dehydrogenase, zinc-type, GroES-like superfamily, NAD(P)-binding domain superfamily [Septoria linicola]USW48995.1 Putative alcohol dehydrogenase, zinc-type, GroES-like superfamily, NAD(P)-binding domain superfamily [Septoria linicola]